jgi:hypothetical protein
MENRIIPCPSCGNSARVFFLKIENGFSKYRIRCTNDNCKTMQCGLVYYSKEEEAIAEWNKWAQNPNDYHKHCEINKAHGSCCGIRKKLNEP